MAQQPGTGTLEEVLRFLKALMASAAFTAEVNAITAQINASQVYTVTDVNNATYQINTQDTNGVAWVPTAFKRIMVSDNIRIGADNPELQLFGQPGRISPGVTGEFRLDQTSDPMYDLVIDGAVLTYASASSDPARAEREALILADACDRLVMRNPSLGGLVRHIESDGPPVPASAPAKAGGTTGGALIRWRAKVLRVTQ